VCCSISDSSRDNSQSSTDTASFSGSTLGSCPPSAEKVKLEDVVENGMFFARQSSLLCGEWQRSLLKFSVLVFF